MIDNKPISKVMYGENEIPIVGGESRSPKIIDVIDISQLDNNVNEVIFNLSDYDLSNYNCIYLVCENCTNALTDWLYIGDNISEMYTSGQINSNAKYTFVGTPCLKYNNQFISRVGNKLPYLNMASVTFLKTYLYNTSNFFKSGVITLYGV